MFYANQKVLLIISFSWFLSRISYALCMHKFVISLLAYLARMIIVTHRPYIIGITGTVGKTTLSIHVAKYLSLIYGEREVRISPYHYNGEYGLPLSIIHTRTGGSNPFRWIFVFLTALYRCITPYPKYLVLEYGIDHPWEMEWLLSIAIPDISILTGVMPNHLEQFGTLESYRREKLLITRDAPRCIIHESLRPYIEREAIYYGIGSMSDIDASHFHTTIKGMTANIHVHKNTYPIALPSFWAYQIENILPLYAISQILGLDPTRISQESHMFVPGSGRSSILIWSHGETIIDGSYNGWLESIMRGIDSIVPYLPSHKIILILWDMRELGTHTESSHIALAHYILQHISPLRAVDIWLVGPLMWEYVAPLLSPLFSVESMLSSREVGETIARTYPRDREDMIIYVKWSQNTIFLEEAIKPLIKKDQYSLLCRQSSEWMKKKELFFATLIEKL